MTFNFPSFILPRYYTFPALTSPPLGLLITLLYFSVGNFFYSFIPFFSSCSAVSPFTPILLLISFYYLCLRFSFLFLSFPFLTSSFSLLSALPSFIPSFLTLVFSFSRFSLYLYSPSRLLLLALSSSLLFSSLSLSLFPHLVLFLFSPPFFLPSLHLSSFISYFIYLFSSFPSFVSVFLCFSFHYILYFLALRHLDMLFFPFISSFFIRSLFPFSIGCVFFM